MKWKNINDDTIVCEYQGIKMQINYMRSHWAWIVTVENEMPIGGSFLSGRFAKSEEEAMLLCTGCSAKYTNNPETFLDVLEDKTSAPFELKLEVNGIRAILVSMILYEHTQKNEYKENEIATDDAENVELNKVAKSILDQWGEFNKNFEAKNI